MADKDCIELVGKIGSVALIDRRNGTIDYNKFARLGRQLAPGTVWVSSGATEIGRIDYFKRTGRSLDEDDDTAKTDYAAQGQAILMQLYREFIPSAYSVRQLLVEHQHFNDESKRAHIKRFLLRCAEQSAVPIVNYNDSVSDEETRKLEIHKLVEARGEAVQLVDNDETAAQIANLVHAKKLVILMSGVGICKKVGDPSTLIERIGGATAEQVIKNIEEVKGYCNGASRKGAFGAAAKLDYIESCIAGGTTVYIASADCDIADVISGACPRTVIGVGL